MNFKKTNISKKKNYIALNAVGIISILLIFTIGVFFIKNINLININIDKDNLIETNGTGTTEEEKNIIRKFFEKNIITNNNIISNLLTKEEDSNESINILLTGIGGGDHDAPNLTDTIILAKLDTQNKLITMLSIPRDLYVEYNDSSDSEGKINGLYATHSYSSNSNEYGMNQLKQKVTEITGEKIDYFINIDFDGFKEIVDTLGGIKITIPENFVDYQYPDGNWGYKTLIFKKGTWLFDGDNALKYVRSRHSTSDFDRSLRQQQVIEAIKDKLTGSYFLTSPGKIKELYDVFNKNVYTDLTLTKVIKLAYSINAEQDEYKVVSSNMNDSCFYGSTTCSKGGILYIPSREFFNGMSVLLIEGTDTTDLNNYETSKLYSDIIFNYPLINSENAIVNIFNSIKVNNLAGALSNDINKYGFNIPEKNSIGNTTQVYDKSVIYYNNISENSQTIQLLKTFFSGEFIKLEGPKYSTQDANIEIIIGQDYIMENGVFNF